MAAPGENLRINSDRLWDSIMEMAKIGPGIAGGNNRQTVTDEDGEGRHLFKRWCEAAGLEMGLDEMGTMFARREGTDPSLPPVYVGSHLDTQPTGGKFDGVLGVLGALEVVRISAPRSNALIKAENARFVGCPAIGASSIAPIRPMFLISMTFGSPLSECSASSQ